MHDLRRHFVIFPRQPIELLALTLVAEQRALQRYGAHMKRDDVSQATRDVLEAVTRDEYWHVDWVQKKARELAEKLGEPERVDAALEFFRKADREVVAELEETERARTAAVQ